MSDLDILDEVMAPFETHSVVKNSNRLRRAAKQRAVIIGWNSKRPRWLRELRADKALRAPKRKMARDRATQ